MGTENKNELITAFFAEEFDPEAVKSPIESVWGSNGTEETAHLMYTDAFPHRVYCSSCHNTIVPNMEWIGVYRLVFNYCPCCGKRFVDDKGGN